MAVFFRSGMDGIMLCAGGCFKVFAVIALKTAYKCNPDAACQVGIFAISFLTAPPARIAEYIEYAVLSCVVSSLPPFKMNGFVVN